MAGKPQHWKERNGRYSARIVIPSSLRPYLDNRAELEIQLGGDRREALRKHAAAVASMQRQIGIARLKREAATGQQRKPAAHPLTAQQIALRDYQSQISFDSEIRAHDPRYAQIDPDPAYDAQPFRDGFAGKLSDDELEELVGSRIERARLAGNTDAVKGTPEWRALAQALCIASYEAVARRYERNDGDFNGEPSHPMLVEAVRQEESQPIASPFAGITFEDVIKEQERLASIGLSRPKSEATLEKYRNAKDDFEAFRKDKAVATVTLAEGRAWRDHMLVDGKLSRKTIHDKITIIRTLMGEANKQAENQMFPQGEPWAALELPVVQKGDSAERTYSLKDARHFLEFARSATRASFRWIPWIIAHTGARVNEITVLEKRDIFEVEGFWFIHIRVGDGRKTKTHRARKVPVHPGLIKEGFIEWVKAQPNGKLFPGGKNEDQRLREWIHEKVFPKRTDLPPPNHGFRHLFEDALSGGVSERAALYIMGRSSGSSADDYGGSDVKLVEIAKQMKTVRDIIT
ncbi:integrase [Agrobacterium tumefaciens]|uniref:integrase n=1 Tax=Agrobacterium tumefaciens TaxID=358 RepID=UPI003BA207F1